MHKIIFQGVETDWNNALPLGNGKLGAMVYFKNNSLFIALNHYDCYYRIHPDPLNLEDDNNHEGNKSEVRKIRTYEEVCESTKKARKEKDYERSHYLRALNPSMHQKRPTYIGTSYPMAGEIRISLSDSFHVSDSNLTLDIEKGIITFFASDNEKEVKAKIWVAKSIDTVAIKLGQNSCKLWEKACIYIPSMRGGENYRNINGGNENSIWYNTIFPFYDEKGSKQLFTSQTICSCSLANYRQEEGELYLPEMDRNINVAATVLPENRNPLGENYCLLERFQEFEQEHRKAWDKFWVSQLTLPDKFLETLWYLHLYLIECCSGKNSRFVKHACGLNGLWDIRRPSIWGSMWYWDVNIQSAFAGVGSGNHVDLLYLFCSGYLSYENEILRYTKEVYGMEGWALDYPHTLYNCIQPWCAHYLWLYFQFSGDVNFLRDSAYPVFQKQIKFLKFIAKVDDDGIIHIDPDISPEQGPITRDSVITIASIKQLIKDTIEAAKTLNRPNEEVHEYKQLLKAMPEYTRTKDGKRFKDSSLATDELFLRHPSILMPIYPANEISMKSKKDILETAYETFCYAQENTEIGTFGFSWLSAVAARLGDGESAVRILYEQGIDQILHGNGLGYEESERFVNHCLITKIPTYLPAMSEVSGGIINVIQMLLLQQMEDNTILLFPALPDGKKKDARNRTQYKEDDFIIQKAYGPWENCSFTGLLCLGGFEVSAERVNGKTVYLEIQSHQKNVLKIMLPTELRETEGELFMKEMIPGDKIVFGHRSNSKYSAAEELNSIQIREATLSRRRIFLGENKDTKFYKAIDSFTCPYGLSNTRQYQMTPYFFDFTSGFIDKTYTDVYGSQLIESEHTFVHAGGPIIVPSLNYINYLGYGFHNNHDLCIKDRGKPDSLRRDFVEGIEKNEFLIELPKGKYNILIISGDELEDSITNMDLPKTGAFYEGKLNTAGTYQYKIIPFMHEEDSIFRIGLSTIKGYKWKLNAILLNKEYAIL